VFSRVSRVKTMQQVSDIFGSIRNYFKKHSRKSSVFKGFKENKKFFQKVVAFSDATC
jgi:hypothetical protein